MSNIIKPKRSSIVGKVPTANDMEVGEIALNMADGILYFKNNLNEVKPVVGVSMPIDSLSDVVISSASVGNVLVYNGTNWKNVPLIADIELGIALL